MKKLLIAKNIKAYYRLVGGQEIKAVDGVSLDLREDEVLGIAGESGCGKSSLASILGLTYNPPLYVKEGELIAGDEDVFSMNKEELRKKIRGTYISVVPQGAMNALNPTQKISSFVVDVIREHYPEISKREAIERARERLDALGLPERVLSLYPHQLSGGMKQRVIIVISTLLNPQVLICDEPTSALDVSSQKVVIRLLMKLLREKIIRSIVFITHELPLLRHFSDRIAIMYAGKLAEIGPMNDVIFDPVHPYTKALMSSVLTAEVGTKQKQLTGIPGVPPDLKNPPAGCRFSPRCPYAMEKCKTQQPNPETKGDRTTWCWLTQTKEDSTKIPS